MTPRIASTAPVPTLRQLCTVFAPRPADDDALAAPWRTDERDAAFWFSRAAWALRAVVDAHAKSLSEPIRVWLPDYFCNEAIAPIREIGATLVFYPVHETLVPDWTWCEEHAASRGCDLFVLVHYFGMESATAPARAFCDRVDAALIEDAAHVLVPFDGIGCAGDYVFYSLYKHLPIPDGALLLVRTTPAARLEAVGAAARIQADAPVAAGWFARRLLQRLAPTLAARLRTTAPLPFDRDPIQAPVGTTPAMSAAARTMLAAMKDGIGAIAATRANNERAVRAALADIDELAPLFTSPAGEAVPYRAVFRAADSHAARVYYDRIVAAGSVAETWPDLPPEVRHEPGVHHAAIALRETVIALPVHADRTAEILAQIYGAACRSAASASAASRSRAAR